MLDEVYWCFIFVNIAFSIHPRVIEEKKIKLLETSEAK